MEDFFMKRTVMTFVSGALLLGAAFSACSSAPRT